MASVHFDPTIRKNGNKQIIIIIIIIIIIK